MTLKRRAVSLALATRCAWSGFTVLELLVVISIIAILLGILLPAYIKVRDHAKYTKTRVAVKNLEIAFKNYLDYYRTWPSVLDEGALGKEINGDIFQMLQGVNVGGYNPNTIVFYDFDTTNFTEGAIDPLWDAADYDNTKKAYRVRVDANYDNKISVGGNDVYRNVIVWSCGTNHFNDGGTGDDIKSWE